MTKGETGSRTGEEATLGEARGDAWAVLAPVDISFMKGGRRGVVARARSRSISAASMLSTFSSLSATGRAMLSLLS